MTSSHGFGVHSGFFHPVLRQWQSRDTQITPANLMYPVFISVDPDAVEEIPSMPGIKRFGANMIVDHLEPIVKNGLQAVLIFGSLATQNPEYSDYKDDVGSAADDMLESPVIEAIDQIASAFSSLLIVCDVCLCGYTKHGHCGILNEDGTIDNAKSIERLAQIAVTYARAGCHVVAPSDMMDGRILEIKKALDKAGLLRQVSVLSYAAKFSSCFYGPFRDAAGSAPAFGDRKAYQLPGGSTGLAIRASDRDVAEGADMLMVKPALAYLDIIQRIKERHPELPMFAYQVSGEYAMLIHGSNAQPTGLFDLDTAVDETLASIRRAGADVVITYFAPRILERLASAKIGLVSPTP